jgi:uncharacterized protein YjbI with pentapeptide repeats
LLAAVLVMYLTAIAWAPHHLIDQKLLHDPRTTPGDRLNAERDARLLVTSIAGALIVLGGLVFTAVNYRLSRRGQITERFVRALERLGSTELYGRIGGIYALERVMRDSPAHIDDVIEVLAAFIRELTPHAQSEPPRPPQQGKLRWPWRRAPIDTARLPSQPPEDVQAALTAIGRRPRRRIRPTSRHMLPRLADLSGLHLRGVKLDGMDLRTIVLEGADLREAHFEGADLRHAKLSWTDLRGAQLFRADLRHAYLTKATLCDAGLAGADLRNTALGSADLRNARLSRILPRFLAACAHANPDRRLARLIWGRRWGYQVHRAKLRGTVLINADLRGAKLAKVNLRHINLDHTNLQDAQYQETDLHQKAIEIMTMARKSVGIYQEDDSA